MASFNKTLSLYIPRVLDVWASDEAISPIFHQLDIGNISRIDFVEKQSDNGIVYYQAFIYFSEWYDTPSARHLQERILNYAENPENSVPARIVYDEPWYWMLFVNAHPVTEAERDLQQRIKIMEQEYQNLFQKHTALERQLQDTNYWTSCALNHANSLQTDVDFLMAHLGLSDEQPICIAPPPDRLTRSTNRPYSVLGIGDEESSEDGSLEEEQIFPRSQGNSGNRSIDEDDGLMPFVHTPDRQRERALTEEQELEARRRQKYIAKMAEGLYDADWGARTFGETNFGDVHSDVH
jgi:hypothetical protein